VTTSPAPVTTLAPQEVTVPPRSLDRFRSVLGPERMAEIDRAIEDGRRELDGRVVWNVNSTAKGGGVVELLRPLVGYARGAGTDARWVVIEGTPEFFAITKRIHNRLHGTHGDRGPLDDEARHVYESVLEANLRGFSEAVRDGDIVIIHDPQPAGLVRAMKDAGAVVIWRCHVGRDDPNDLVREAWAFLHPYVAAADAYVFSRASYAWDNLDRDRVVVIPPTIDAFTPKNVDIDADTVQATLELGGFVAAGGSPGPVTFERTDGSPGRVERRARIVEDAPLPLDAPMVLQVSRWDALKDPVGVIRGFAEHVPAATGAHLMYAAPDVEAVADDPEGVRMLRESIAARAALPAEVRSRVHLASLPMDDLDENAFMVNALQRHAAVVAQKSLAEGFGLTVAEAMWKARPVVAPRIGGIQDQIADGDTGVLIDDPRDLAAFGAAVTALLEDVPTAEQMGRRARERVREHFLNTRSLLDYLGLIRHLLSRMK
jgi:trehalose synthase